MTERLKQTAHISRLVDGDQEERVRRITGRTLDDWAEVFRRRRQVAHARGLLTAWIPLHEVKVHAGTYGFDEPDDYVYAPVPRAVAAQHGWEPLPGADNPKLTHVIMARINPEKYPL
ncbi:MAG: hypothetical protein KatS3mg042_0666 [Rhodothermaceae bacterium]|nr:MAG: hypothetical protein KatS3mg042_0666 [Rhodothermaceae bacterium]